MAAPSSIGATTTRPTWRRAVLAAGAALGAALAQAPFDAAYGLIALAPLGIGAQAMVLVLLGSAVASGVACVAGGGRLVEDAFIEALGGGPGGDSVLAQRAHRFLASTTPWSRPWN